MLRASLIIVVAVAAAVSACQTLNDTRPEGWATLQVEDLTYPDLFSVTLTTLDAEGYLVRERDPEQGRINTDWQYGTSQTEYRGPSRRRVIAELQRLEEGPLELRLRRWRGQQEGHGNRQREQRDQNRPDLG